jgi:hypothetical protein
MKQVRNGHGFEGVVALAISNELKVQGVSWAWDENDKDATLLRLKRIDELPPPLRAKMEAAGKQIANYIVKEYVKSDLKYKLGTGDNARKGDIADVTLRNCTKDIPISVKWNSNEIKGPRFHPALWSRKYGTCDSGDWIIDGVNLSSLLRDYTGKPWSELKADFGDELLHSLFQKKLREQIELVAQSEELSLRFAHEHFGMHDHLRAFAKTRRGKKPIVVIADFRKKDTVGQITLVKNGSNPHWVNVHFGHSFVLGLRLHSRGSIVSRDGMSYSTIVKAWGRPECRLT